MDRKGENMNQRVMRLSHKKPVVCRCKECRSQCESTPCIGTPLDIKRLVDNGYADRLVVTYNASAMLLGQLDHPVKMIATDFRGGKCPFFTAGRLCELHDLGLKPLEGRLSHHSTNIGNFLPRRSIAINILREWENPDNAKLVNELFEYFKNKQNDYDEC